MGIYLLFVRRRTSEIGLRMALGASSGNIVRPAVLGIAPGAIGAWWLSRYVATLLFGVKPLDSLLLALPARDAHRSGGSSTY